jgi:hypothetical protein
MNKDHMKAILQEQGVWERYLELREQLKSQGMKPNAARRLSLTEVNNIAATKKSAQSLPILVASEVITRLRCVAAEEDAMLEFMLPDPAMMRLR